jgi:hypothetical protein
MEHYFKLQANANSFPPEASRLREGGHAIGVDGRVYTKNHKAMSTPI